MKEEKQKKYMRKKSIELSVYVNMYYWNLLIGILS